ncbi:MAG: 2-hydroxymuconate tautomerase family protein [Nannocystaceae bacterium]|nr:2-hydroxymuconate tautomerase family protein [Nannocystaceae bacterium]
MPIINIRLTDEGVTSAQKQALITASTELVRDVLGKEPATTFVLIDEVPTDNWGVGGESVTRRRGRKTTTAAPPSDASAEPPATTPAPIANNPEPGYVSDFAAILALLADYFDGLFVGDVDKLRAIFHEDAWLKGSGYRKTRDAWLHAVAARPIPRDEGMRYRFKVQSLEIVGDQAMAKVDCPLLAAHFVDFLGLLKEQGEWKIVSKMFTVL